MFIDLPPHPATSRTIVNDWHAPVVKNEMWFYCDVTRQFVEKFTVGQTVYRPIRQLTGTFEPPTPNILGRFSVSGLTRLAGRGTTIDAARTDWELNTDAMIQQLLGVQDFERTADDKENLKQLSAYFDLTEIRYSSPIQIRSYGKLFSIFPRPCRIQWIDGTTSLVNRHQVPAELVRYAVGEEFEAVIEQDSRTGELIKIVSVFKTQRKWVSDSDVAELLSKTKSSKDLADLDWD